MPQARSPWRAFARFRRTKRRVKDEKAKAAEYRRFWTEEMEAAYRYRALADAATADQRTVFIALADVEERHAGHWAAKLTEIGETPPAPSSYAPGLGVKFDMFLARSLGIRSAVEAMERKERASSTMYDDMPDAAEGMAAEERGHGQALAKLLAPPRSDPRIDIQRYERWHRTDSSGATRAAIFGMNDGLVANASLVMGVAGGTGNTHFIVLAGISGLLAGAFSMGVGEFISVTSQRELFEHEIEVEAREIDEHPEEETEELALIYQAKGVPKDQAEAMSKRIMSDRRQAIDTLAREELGLNPDELGSPWRVMFSSFFSFIVGAAVPVVPFLFLSGTAAVIAAFAAFAVALLAVGSAIGVFAGRQPWIPALRQLFVGAVASTATFAIGRLIGASMHG
jgi:VIT1/CCC1 family predicted Fe2+/Mn2+ transporter